MTPNNNFSVLPWYNNIEEQNHRKSYAYGAIYPLFTPANFILPFQVMRAHRNANITTINLYNKDGQLVQSLLKPMRETGLQIVNVTSEYDVILYPGTLPMGTNIMNGIYYLVMGDGVQTWVSEMFTVVQDVSSYVKIEWWDVENMVFDSGLIIYDNPKFKNVLYLCTEIGKPEYQFEEEGETRDGYFFPEKQISEKTYKFTFTAPEYLCDVMRFIRMADYVRITDTYGRKYNCDTFLITPKWQTQGDIASVEVEFETDTVVKKIARGYTMQNIGDYNDDFNNDFDNQ